MRSCLRLCGLIVSQGDGAAKVSPFELVCGQEVMLPVKVNLDAYRLAKQNDLSAIMY